MERAQELQGLSHIIKLNDRKNIIISGVKRINNFDDKEFNIDTVMGSIVIRGEGLEMIKLDTIEGNVTIKGKVNSLSYSDVVSKDNSFFMKLFRWFSWYWYLFLFYLGFYILYYLGK